MKDLYINSKDKLSLLFEKLQNLVLKTANSQSKIMMYFSALLKMEFMEKYSEMTF